MLALSSCSEAEPEAPEEPPLNLLLISIDTLRADRLSCYGYERDTTPAIDRFAEEAVVFRRAIAESPWTIPSHVSLLSGLYPTSHGVQLPTQVPAPDVPWLADILEAEGYYNFAITDGGWLSEEHGFARGFRSFHADEQDFAQTLEEAGDYIRHRADRGPFFGFLHTYDVHCPYDPPPQYLNAFVTPGRAEFEAEGRCGNPYFNERGVSPEEALYLSDRYDAGVRWVDDAFAGFLRFLEDEGVLENTVVVITSDHGEELFEHGRIGHEGTLHKEALMVPLIVRAPGLAPRVVEEPAGLVDVVPTLVEILGVRANAGFDGESLLPLIHGAAPKNHRAFRLSELGWKAELDSWLGADVQLIVDRKTGSVNVYPSEDTELENYLHGEALRMELDAFLHTLEENAHAPELRAPYTDEELARLRQLGYTGD